MNDCLHFLVQVQVQDNDKAIFHPDRVSRAWQHTDWDIFWNGSIFGERKKKKYGALFNLGWHVLFHKGKDGLYLYTVCDANWCWHEQRKKSFYFLWKQTLQFAVKNEIKFE